MKVVVTGGSGKLGHWIVRELASDFGVLNFDRTRDPRAAGGAFLAGDITDLGQVYGALAGADAVIHAAGIPTHSVAPNEVIFATNALGTFNVHEAAWRLDIKRVVTLSSEAVLGWAPGARTREFLPSYLPIDEDHPYGAQDAYGLSKIAAAHAPPPLAPGRPRLRAALPHRPHLRLAHAFAARCDRKQGEERGERSGIPLRH